jgi:hypothetical protein
MASVEANVQPLERELIIYEKGIPELLEMDTPLYQLIDKQEADPASNRATRIPLLMQVGGTFQQVSMDGGTLGTTGGPQWQVATLTPIYFTSGYSYTLLAKYATTGAARGIKTTTGEVMRLSIKQFKTYLDMAMNTAGNAVLGTITSAGPPLTLTTDGFKEELFMIGQNVDVWNAALTTNRGTSTITAIDRVGHTITLLANPGGTIATDLVLISGLTGTVTNQSSLFGIQYHQSDATSGTWLNLNRATFPQVVTPSINANSSSLTTGMIRAALNRVRINLGDDFFNTEKTKMVAYMHPSQADSYESIAALISAIWKDPTGNQNVDLLFNNQSGLSMSNVPVKQSIHQDRTRIDFLSLGYWGRIVGTDTGFVKFGDQILWPLVDTSTGSLKATEQFWLNAGLQLFNKNPLSGSYIKTLQLPLIGASSIY